MVAPRPAPAATPSVYGSASGLANTPWYAAPQEARVAPTSRASTTRGRRSSLMIAVSVAESPDGSPRTSFMTPTGGSATEPTTRPSTVAARTARMPATSHTGRSLVSPACTAGASPASAGLDASCDTARSPRSGSDDTSKTEAASPPSRPSATLASGSGCRSVGMLSPGRRRRFRDGGSNGTQEVDDPRSPALRDVVVERDNGVVLHRREIGEATALGQRLRALPAAFGVCKEDQIGICLDEVLRRQLRISTALLVSLVGDVLEPDKRIDLPGEGVRCDREQRVVQLVVVGEWRRPFGNTGNNGVDVRLHLGHGGRRLCWVAGGLAKQLDLAIGVVELLCGGKQQGRNGEPVKPRDDVLLVIAQQDEVRPIASDCLDIRLESGELGPRRLRREIRLIVDGFDLIARTDRVHHLGCCRRERDDAFGPRRDGYGLARGTLDSDRECCCARALAWRLRGTPATIIAAARIHPH